MRSRPRFVFFIPAAIATAALLACGPVAGRASPGAPAQTHEASSAAAPVPQESLGPELARLNALAGRWDVRQSMWSDPARPPAVDRGEAILTPVLGGRHLRQDLRIDSPKGTFRGLGYLGYDQATHQYESLWMDVNFTGMIRARGTYDPAHRTYELTGAVPDPNHAGATLRLREVMHVQDADHFTYEYYEPHGGRQMLAVRLEYTRRR
ncbi:DUF1579 family protein [Frateuria sp. GZRR35]|uniref:DUF1579 family protein n=1 Tax=Frateuria sp. GZRR35 TaxID=3351536 RepID=UPI003EDB8825